MKLQVVGGLIFATVLAGCASQPLAFGERSTAAARPVAKTAMAGRWVLSAPGVASCGMRFGGGPDDGAIEPGAGCPGDFFTSRQWTLNQGKLTIEDYQGQTLAELNYAQGRFSGRSVRGKPVTLSRS